MQKVILPSITSTRNPKWKEQINEVKDLNLSQVALFLSGLDLPQRHSCYQSLEQIKDLVIPFVHARSDMEPSEYQYLQTKFKTEIFNLHPLREFPLNIEIGDLKQKIYIENTYTLFESDLQGFAGICLDVSHLEEDRLIEPENFRQIISFLDKYPIGVNHISAIRPGIITLVNEGADFDSHQMLALSEFDYLKKYPETYFGKYIAIELTNSIKEQLGVIDYISNFFPSFAR